MKIALVCPYDWARHGGVQAHVAQLARALSDDHDVHVFAPSSEHRDGGVRNGRARAQDARHFSFQAVGRPLPVRFNRSVAPVGLSPQAGRRILRGLEAFAPHILHVHEPLVPVVSLAAALGGPTPLIGTYHAWSERDLAYRAMRGVAQRVHARLAATIAVSPVTQTYASEALGIPPGAFRVIPNGVEVDRFRSAEPIPELLDPERPLMLFVGRLEPRKGLDVLVRAFLRLRAGSARPRLCVVGDGPERERCQQMIPSSIRPDVLFVGAVDEREKARYHASADVYVAPNVGGEGFGIVLLEAMAAGLPVVATEIPAFRTVLRDGRQGRLVPPNDAVALAEALTTLLSNSKLRAAMAREGHATVAQYDWPVVAGRIEQLYHAAYLGS
ncbi:MAG: glycosyltransferase family 4 protein [Egibacteraceae bacterium]